MADLIDGSQAALSEVTIKGQKKLKAARGLCVGTGRLGSPLALYLTAAGVGALGLVDFNCSTRFAGIIQCRRGDKLILGAGEPLIGRLLLADELALRLGELRVRQNPKYPACGGLPTVKRLIDCNQFCGFRGEDSEVSTSMIIPEIQPEELKRRLDANEDVFVLDVREPHEHKIANIHGHLIPLGDLPARVHELDSTRETVVYCKSGMRSAMAVDFLLKSGFKRASNLAGGILAWADRIDPSLSKY